MAEDVRKIYRQEVGSVEQVGGFVASEQVVGFHKWKLVQVLPDVFICALVEQGSVGTQVQKIIQVPVPQFRSWFAHRQKRGGTMRMGLAKHRQRALRARLLPAAGQGKRRRAIERAELHNRRIEQPCIIAVEQVVNQGVKVFLARSGVKCNVAIV